MSCSKTMDCTEAKTKSKMSRFAIVPILRRKTNSVVSDRIITALRKSSFCSSNPVIKKLIVQNVHVWCIVIETSGTQSIKVICASIPYLLKLLSRANPKLKQILEDENVVSYLKFFQETDLESILASVCTATVIIQKGIRMCQPTLCVQLSRDALMFGNVTLKAILNILYDGMMSTFQFLWEDLGPAFRSFCSRNRMFVKYIVENLPVYALATAKGLVLSSFFVRRVFQCALKIIKQFVNLLGYILQESSADLALIKNFESLKIAVKNLANLMLSANLYQYCKCMCLSSGKWCIECVKIILPILFKECSNFIKGIFPFVKKYIRFAIQSTSTAARFLEENIIRFIKFCYNSKPVLQQILLTIKPYLLELYKVVISFMANIIEVENFMRPYIKQFAVCLLKKFIQLCVNLIHGTVFISNYISNKLNNIPDIYPELKHLLINLFKTLNHMSKYILLLCKDLYTNLLNIVRILCNNSLPLLLPVGIEMHSTLKSCSNEVITKFYAGMRKVLPCMWLSFRTVSPPTYYATQEVFITSKKAVTIMYPNLLQTIVTISPEVSKAIIVVLKDGNKAFLEVATVTYSASSQLLIAAKNVSRQVPVVLHAVNEVTVGTSSAVSEVSLTSYKAQTRMWKDSKMAALVVGSSLKSVKVELVTVLDEIVFVVNDSISDSPDLQALVTEGLIISSSFWSNFSNILCATFSYTSFKIQKGCLVLNDYCDIFKVYLKKLVQLILEYLSNSLLNSSDQNSVLSIALSYLSKVIQSNILQCCLNSLLNIILRSNEFLKLNYVYNNVKQLVIIFLYYVSVQTKRYTCIACSELVHNIIPKSWNLLKFSVFILWDTFCNLTSEGWTRFEHFSARTWCFICENFPEIWAMFKNLGGATWNKTCKYGPRVWDYTLITVPVMWSSNCYMVKSVWDLYVETCSQTWNHTVPLSSNSWSYALDNSPKLWVSVSENSKTNWKLFCYVAENSWELVTDTSSVSWDLLNKIVSKSWHSGIRPVTTSVCCKTSTMLVNSMKISYGICAKTGSIICYLYDELSGTLISSKLEENSTKSHEILKKCIAFSPANILKPGTKRKWLRRKIKNLIKIPSQVSGTSDRYLKLDKMIDNVCTIPKISFIPISSSYALGQDLVKRYYSMFTLFKNVYFSSSEMFPELTSDFNSE